MRYKQLDISVEAEQTGYKKDGSVNYASLGKVADRINALYTMGIEVIGLPTHTGLSEGRRIPNIKALDYFSENTKANFMFHIKPFYSENGEYMAKTEERIEGELLELSRSYGSRIAYLLPVTGDRKKYTDSEKPKVVKPRNIEEQKGVSSISILNVIYKLNSGLTRSGFRIKPPNFNPVAVAINPWNSTNPLKKENEIYTYERKDHEYRHLMHKIDAIQGRSKIVGLTQPVYSATMNDLKECIIRCVDKTTDEFEFEPDLSFVVGLSPVRSLQAADYIRKNVEGFNIPDDYYDHLRQANGTGEYFATIEAASALNKVAELQEELFDKYGKEIITGVHFYMADDANFLGNILESAKGETSASIEQSLQSEIII